MGGPGALRLKSTMGREYCSKQYSVPNSGIIVRLTAPREAAMHVDPLTTRGGREALNTTERVLMMNGAREPEACEEKTNR